MRPQIGDRALLALLATITALGTVSTHLYLPALPSVREHFGASVAEVQATFSVALATFSVGVLAWGPIADRFGRRKAVLAGLAVFAAGALICLGARSLGWLVAGRGILAFGTATGMVVARAIVVDRYPVERMARMLATLTVATVLGNSLAPAAGGFLTASLGWRSIFGALVAAAFTVGFVVWRHLPETRPPTGRKPQGREMLGVAWSLLKQPMFTGCMLQGAAVYATFLVFLSLTPYVMVSALGRPTTEYGFYYLLIAAGYILGNWSVTRLMAHHDLHWMVLTGVGLTVLGAVAALAFALLGALHPLWLFVPMSVLAFGQGLALPNVTATAVALAPEHAGVASSTVGFLQQLIGATCVQLAGHFSTASAVPMLTFCVVVTLLALAMLYAFPRVEAGFRHC